MKRTRERVDNLPSLAFAQINKAATPAALQWAYLNPYAVACSNISFLIIWQFQKFVIPLPP